MVVVADLVARISASGVQETAAAVKAVGDQAAITARALENMAAAYAKQMGGTPAQALDMFQRQGAVPNAAAMAQAAQDMQKTAVAAGQAVQPTQAVARAASEHATAAANGARAVQTVADGWKLSETSVIRFVSSLAGVSLGLNLASGAARTIHQEIVASVEAAVELDRVGRGLAATYGAGAGGSAAFARTLAPQAFTTPGVVERGLTAAGPLVNQFGLSQDQVQQLTSRAADISGRFGQPFQQVFSDVVKGVESGGTGLQQYNVRLDDTYVKTVAWNGALASTYDRMTQAQQVGARFNQFMSQTASVQGSAATAATTLSGSLDKLSASIARVQQTSGALTTGGIAGPADALSSWLDQLSGVSTGGNQRHAIVPDPTAPGGARIITGPPQFDLSGIPGAGPSTTTPPSFIGPLRQPFVTSAGVSAGYAGGMASTAAAEAGAQLQAISLRSEERRLSVAQELAGYKTDQLQTESQLAPLMLQQALIQDRITVASRDNLQSRRALIQAEQQQLSATRVTSQYDYQQRRLELLAEQSRANVRIGGAPTQDIGALRQQYREIDLQRAASGADLAALDSARGVEVVSQQRTGEQLSREATLANLDEQTRALQDQRIPLEQNQRLYQAEEASIQRTLDLLDLQDTNERTAAQQRQNEANQLRLVVDEIARQADDYAHGLNLGATAAERSQAALEKARDAVRETIPLLQSLPQTSEVAGRLANGLGGGGLGAGPNVAGSNGVTLVLVRANDPAGIRQEIGAALDQLLAGASTSGAPAPSTVGGAGR